jgi:integrase
MNAAVRDGVITKNPCQIPGAGSDRAKERPIADPAQVAALIEAITPRCRAAILLATWCGLRRGEVLALYRGDIALASGTVTVRRNRVELLTNHQEFDADPTGITSSPITGTPHTQTAFAAYPAYR